MDPRPLADTEGATCPFFSLDGGFIGFGAQDKLKKVSVDGGRVVTLTDAAQLRGGSWGEDGTARDGTLVFAPWLSHRPKRTLVWVDRTGRVTQASSRQGEIGRGLLSPDGGRIAVSLGHRESSETFVLELGRGTWTRVPPDGGVGLDDWLPDGERLLQTRVTGDSTQLVVSRVDGAAPVATLTDDYVDADCFSRHDPVVVPARTFLAQLL